MRVRRIIRNLTELSFEWSLSKAAVFALRGLIFFPLGCPDAYKDKRKRKHSHYCHVKHYAGARGWLCRAPVIETSLGKQQRFQQRWLLQYL